MENLNVSEQQAEPVSAASGSVEPTVLHASDAPAVSGSSPEISASLEPAIRTEAPDLVPDQGANETSEIKAPEMKAPEVHVPEIHAASAKSSPTSGKLMIMSPGDRTWTNESNWSNEHSWTGESMASEAKAETVQNPGLLGKRRIAAMAAVVALATIAGAAGGALVTASFGHFAGAAQALTASSNASNQALEATVARIDADVVALKAGVEHTSKMEVSQFNKTSDRLDRLEKAQAEPAAKLAKLSEAVEKLHATPPAAPVAAAAPAPQPAPKEVTGSIAPPAAAPVNPATPKIEVARLPTVEDWLLRDIGHGGALIEGRQGIYEVYAGDQVPGLGRIDAIRRQDGRWVVVTSRGLIVAR
jgi:hypothetical protein